MADRVTSTRGTARPVGCRGLLHLLQQLGIDEHSDWVRGGRDGAVDDPPCRMTGPPQQHVAQDCSLCSMECDSQLLQLGMRLCIKASLPTGAVAHMSRLMLRWEVHRCVLGGITT